MKTYIIKDSNTLIIKIDDLRKKAYINTPSFKKFKQINYGYANLLLKNKISLD